MNGKWSNAEEPSTGWSTRRLRPLGDPPPARSVPPTNTSTRKGRASLAFASALVNATASRSADRHATAARAWRSGTGQEGRRRKKPLGSMLRQVELGGGKVKGLLWYQGESDAMNPDAPSVSKVFADFIAAVAPTSISPSCRSTTCRSAGTSERRPEGLERRAGRRAPAGRASAEPAVVAVVDWSSTT